MRILRQAPPPHASLPYATWSRTSVPRLNRHWTPPLSCRNVFTALIMPPILVLDEGVDPSRRSNPELSPDYKSSPHSRCYPGWLRRPESNWLLRIMRPTDYRFPTPQSLFRFLMPLRFINSIQNLFHLARRSDGLTPFGLSHFVSSVAANHNSPIFGAP